MVVAMELVPMAVAVAAAARPTAGLEGTTAEAATEADNQVARLEMAGMAEEVTEEKQEADEAAEAGLEAG